MVNKCQKADFKTPVSNKWFEFSSESSNAVYIDFHCNEAKTADYDGRISVAKLLDNNNTPYMQMDLTCGLIYMNATTYLNGTTIVPNTRAFNCYGQFYTNNTATFMADLNYINLVYVSDRRLKENIVNVDENRSLEKIINSKVYAWNYKHRPNKINIGFMADELEPVNQHCISTMISLPEYEDEKDVKAVNMQDMFVHNVNAVKVLHSIIQGQASKITSLEAEISSQREEINSLKEIVRQQNETLTNIITHINSTPNNGENNL
jgi:hypothetical protein